MKKIVVLCIGICLLSLPVSSATNFYTDDSGDIVMQMTDCGAEELFVTVLEGTQRATSPDVDDDPPTGTTITDDPTPEQGEGTDEKPKVDTVEAAQLLVNILLGDNDPQPDSKSKLTEAAAQDPDQTPLDFEDLQESLLAFVRDVNWKTGLKITFRDLTWFSRFKMACKGITSLTKPLRANLETYIGNMDSQIDHATDNIIDKIADAAQTHDMSKMVRLSVSGLVDAVDTQNPFLIMLVDHETYNQMVALEPKVANLYQDMYTFFKIRAVRMPGDKYDKNTPALIDITKLGKGNYFETWHWMSDFAQRMLQLEVRGLLNAQDEKDIHIVRLKASLVRVQEQTRVEKRAAEIAFKDPQNANTLRELQQEPKKKPSLDDKARELLQKMTQEQIKALLRKYKMK